MTLATPFLPLHPPPTPGPVSEPSPGAEKQFSGSNLKRLIGAVILSLATLPAAQATQWYHIDCEATIIDGPTTFYLVQDNLSNCVGTKTHNVFKAVVNSYDSDYNVPRIHKETSFKGNGCLEFSWPNASDTSTVDPDIVDKIMYPIAPHYDIGQGNTWDPASPLQMENPRYTGFALYIPTTDTMPIRPNAWLMLYQAYQMVGRPPFSINISRNGQYADSVDLLFLLRDDINDQSQQGGNSENAKTTETVNVKRGTWYSFVIYQRPSADPSVGQLIVYMAEGSNLPPSSSPDLNNYRVVNYHGTWGYPSTQTNNQNLFSCQIGLYGSEYPKAARVLFDEIKFGTIYDDTSPCAAPLVTSAVTAGNHSSAFIYTINATGSPTSYGATSLPSGLTLVGNVISGTLVDAVGNYTIALSAANSAGTGTGSLIVIIRPAGSPTGANLDLKIWPEGTTSLIVHVEGPALPVVTIERSADLINWKVYETLVDFDGSDDLAVPVPRFPARVFYRAR